MTILEFQQKYCRMCGTQSCFGKAGDISHCGYYNGEIAGLPKIKSAMELFEESMQEKGITWEDIQNLLRKTAQKGD